MNYSELKAAVAHWLHRSTLSDRIPEFIRLAEARFNRTLIVPEREEAARLVATSGTVPLPADLWAVRALRLEGGPPISQMSLAELRSSHAGGAAGAPVHYALNGSNLVLAPAPSAATVLILDYYRDIPALSDANTSNWLLAAHPDVYLYGALLQAEAFIVSDERLPVWKLALDEAIAEVRQAGRRKAMGGAPLAPRSPASQVRGVRA